MKQKWILYGTIGCHLCDEAITILRLADIDFIYIDISDHENLMELYALTIPVLVDRKKPNRKIRWPFNEKQLAIWLNDGG